MSEDDKLVALIDLIYEAVLDGDLWPSVLTKLADAMGARQTIAATLDRSAQDFSTIAPRTDPMMVAAYKDCWAFQNPLWNRTTTVAPGKVFSLDNLMSREDFVSTPVFNEWWRPAEYGLGGLGANLRSDDHSSSLIFIVNGPANDFPTDSQKLFFKAALRHLDRALRIHRRLWALDLDLDSARERLETMRQGAFLVDAEARVLFANRAARAMLESGDGFVFRDHRLAAADGSNLLRDFIASCAPRAGASRGPGGEFEVRRSRHRSTVRVTVTPLRSKGAVAEIPWLGLRAPVAIVLANDPDIDLRRTEHILRRQFGLTAAESKLAAEIVKGDGRKAAASRRGITDSTARTQLSSIFAKTGTHRQAQLVRLLAESTSGVETEH